MKIDCSARQISNMNTEFFKFDMSYIYKYIYIYIILYYIILYIYKKDANGNNPKAIPTSIHFKNLVTTSTNMRNSVL